MSDVQFSTLPDVIDLTWGHPDPAFLPTEAVAEATERTLRVHGWQALAYGAPAGPWSLRLAIADRLAASGEGLISANEVLVTAGASGGLELVLSMYARRRDVVFVEQPTYFLALAILSDHGVNVIGVASDDEGVDPEDLARHASEQRAEGDDRRLFVYCIPTFANPTGRSLSLERRSALLTVAAAADITVIEDDVYRDTADDAPSSMWMLNQSLVHPARVFRLGSFSKSLAPGLRVGYLTTSAATVTRMADYGQLDSGGGISHFAAMVVTDLLESGRFATIARAAAERLRARRNAFADSIDGDVLAHRRPDGGFFLWLRVPAGITSHDFTAAARRSGVLVSDGRPFFTGVPDGHFVRASCSMLDEPTLRTAGELLTATARSFIGR